MLRLKWAILCVVGLLAAVPAVHADFTLTDPGVSGTGSGDAIGTAIISDTGPWDVPDVGGFMDTETVTPTSAAIAFQESHVEALDGTGTVSTNVGAHTDTQVIGGNNVTATTSGSTSVSVDKENNPARATLFSEATSRLIAAGGTGTITNNEFFNTQTGFMLTNADAYAYSTGNDSADRTTITDVTADASGSANVLYRFAGSPGPETVSIADADVSSTADIDEDTTQQNVGGIVVPGATATSNSYVIGKVGWTDSETLGQTFGAEVGINAESEAVTVDEDDDPPLATAAAAGNVDVDFTYRPIANPVFSFLGNAGGSAASDAAILDEDDRPADAGFDNDGVGTVQSAAGKNAVGVSGTAVDASPLALAWLHATVSVFDNPDVEEDDFQAIGNAVAINPAQFATQDPVYDPSMTVGTQYGTFSAAMGSSTLTNARVEASIEVLGEDDDEGLDDNEAVFASAFGFAVSALDRDMLGYVDSNLSGARDAGDSTLFNLASENAFVGQGSIALADLEEDDPTEDAEGQHFDDDTAVTVTANTYNLFGTASSPSFFGTMNNGDSSASITPVFEEFIDANDFEVDHYDRASSASADSVTGTNYPVGLALNEMDTQLGFNNVPWWTTYFAPTDEIGGGDARAGFLEGAIGFIGAGGN